MQKNITGKKQEKNPISPVMRSRLGNTPFFIDT